jgi:hypothetical protein
MKLETTNSKITINGCDVSDMKVNRINNCFKVLRHILKHGSITSDQAKDFLKVRRLAARIYDLRNSMNYKIDSHMVYSKDEKYAVYTLGKDNG